MTTGIWMLFIAASLPVHVAPGPNNLLAIRNGAAMGIRRAAAAMLGRLPGYALIFLAAGLGMAALLVANPMLLRGLTIAGGAYIAWLGVTAMAKGGNVSPSSTAAAARPIRSAVTEEFATAVSNPKAILFATAFYAQFLPPTTENYASIFARMVILSLTLESGAALLWCAAGALLPALLGRGRSLAWVMRASGGTLAVLGLLLAARAVFT